LCGVAPCPGTWRAARMWNYQMHLA
jgi:hypothetical protein